MVRGRMPYGRNCWASQSSVMSLPFLASAQGRSVDLAERAATRLRLNMRLALLRRNTRKISKRSEAIGLESWAVAVSDTAACRADAGQSAPARSARDRRGSQISEALTFFVRSFTLHPNDNAAVPEGVREVANGSDSFWTPTGEADKAG